MDPETPQFALPALPQLREQKVFGRSIRYYDTGSGPPLVLVHGVGGDADHSLGGWIVASFALQYPDRVDKLILNDAAGIDEGAIPIPIDLNVSTCANMRTVFEAMFHDRSLVQDALELAYSLHPERGDGPTIKSVLETLGDVREKLDGTLGRLRMQTLILWGENDAVTPVAMAPCISSAHPEFAVPHHPRVRPFSADRKARCLRPGGVQFSALSPQAERATRFDNHRSVVMTGVRMNRSISRSRPLLRWSPPGPLVRGARTADYESVHRSALDDRAINRCREPRSMSARDHSRLRGREPICPRSHR